MLVAGIVIARIVLVGRSGCEFYRNGSWYAAADAQSHLASKYRKVDEKRPVRSVQDFIDWVGTRSSMSGEAYRVRCPGSDAITSAEWFRRELERRPLQPSSPREYLLPAMRKAGEQPGSPLRPWISPGSGLRGFPESHYSASCFVRRLGNGRGEWGVGASRRWCGDEPFAVLTR